MEYYQIECPTCHKILDKRNPGEILSHGMLNPKTGEYECLDVSVDDVIDHDLSMKKGDSIQWTKDKKQINLN